MRSLPLVAGLVGFSSLIQVMVVARAVTTELDSIRFVETAQQIAEQGLVPALRASTDQPLFPVAIWLVHGVVERIWGDFRLSWVLSAQIAGAIPLALAVIPVYFLSVRLVGREPALAGSLLFCVLPEVCSLGANGISDSSHLLFLCLAYWVVAIYLTGPDNSGPEGMARAVCPPRPPQSPLWLLLVGLAVGMALLTRAEALILPAALVLSLGLLQLHPKCRQAWWRPIAATGCLILGIAVPLAPYLVAVEATTPASAVARILGRPDPNAETDHAAPSAEGVANGRLTNGEPMSFTYKDPSIQIRRRGVGAVTKLCSEELADIFGYWVGPFALLGVWWLRRVLFRPIDWFDYMFLGLYGLAAASFASREGYLCARHLLAILVVGIGCGGYGLLETGRWLARRMTSGRTGRLAPLLCSVLPWLAVAIAGVACLIESAKPLNHVYLCHRQAAEWLAHDADTPGEVLDTWGLTGLYSGRKTCPYRKAPTVLDSPHLAYVVLESRELEFATRRSRTLHALLAAAEPAASFTTPLTAHGDRTVVVYRWHPERWQEMQNSECRRQNGGR
jgi:hypothetical protein